MNPLKALMFVACLAAAAFAAPNQRSNSVSNQLQPTEWLSPAQLESLPALNQITMQQLENIPLEDGAELIEKLFHLSQIKQDFQPSYVPNPDNIQAYIIKPNGQNVSVNLNQLTAAAKQEPNFGDEEVTIFLTGYPQTTPAIRKATRKLVQAYMQRYSAEMNQQNNNQQRQQQNNRQQQNGQNAQNGQNGQQNAQNQQYQQQYQRNQQNGQNQQQQQQQQYEQNQRNAQNQQQRQQHQQQNNQYYNNYYDDNEDNTSSEESQNQWSQSQSQTTPTGDLIVINLGDAYKNFANIASLDVEQTGAMIAEKLMQLTQQCNVPEDIIHVVAQGPSAHVAGAAARHFKRHTGRPVRRITALDPSKLYAQKPKTLSTLARGDADFVDAIHTSAYGLGTPNRCGDVDFYPNGPAAGVPGADNVVEATMRATRYFAESVRPGNERNFPAVAANSLQQYNNNNGHGKRAYMGIATDYDLQGDYVLQVSPNSPFGRSTPAQRQNTYHAARQGWKNRNGQDYE